MKVNTPFSYADPRVVERLEDCSFYHCMDLPGIGTVGQEWDLRDTIDAYLGHFNFAGKRVLDVGAASGFLTFEMERRGAEIVSFDMDSGHRWNLVPHFKVQGELDALYEQAARCHQRLQNAYWFAHRALGSQARVYYGDIYDLPEELGDFDVVFLGMILSHLRDPFQALYSATRLSTDTVIITNPARSNQDPAVHFIPQSGDANTLKAWWSFSDGCLLQMLEVLGFRLACQTSHPHQCLVEGHGGTVDCTTFIFSRFDSAR